MHLLEGLIDEQSYAVFFSAGDIVTIDYSCLANTKTKDATIPIDEGANVLRQELWGCEHIINGLGCSQRKSE